MKKYIGLSVRNGLIFLCLIMTSVLSSGSITTQEISWKILRGFNLKTGQMSDALSKMNGKTISIPGFVVPLDDMLYSKVARFLLVPDPQACIHAPPPPANQMLYVVMQGTKKAPVRYGTPILLTGKIKIKSIRSQFGQVTFQVQGLDAQTFQGR